MAVNTKEAMIETMRVALAKIAANRSDCGKPALTRRDMQSCARRALIDCGYRSWSEPLPQSISEPVGP